MEKRLTVILNNNGSIELISDDDATNSQNWIPTIFLLLGFSIGTGLGLITLLGLRIKSCPRSLIGLQVVVLLDCIQSQVLGALFLAVKPNEYFCRLSACASTTFLVIVTIEVMLLTFPLQNLQLGIIPWIIGIFIGLFIIFDYQTPVNFYRSRHGCSVVNGQHGWLPMALILIFGTSWLGSASGIIYNFVFRKKNLEIIVSRIITLLYVILVLPTALILLISISLKPRDKNNDVTENVLTWCRYQFNLLIPLVILIFYKQVRKESENVLCLCRKNSIGLSNTNLNNTTVLHMTSRKNIFNKYQKLKSNPSTPVLFATSKGLYLRTMQSNQLTATLSCELCDLLEHTTSKTVTAHDVLKEPKKNVRFASPLGCDIHFNESGVWSNTEDKAHLSQIQQENEEITSPDNILRVTYTKM